MDASVGMDAIIGMDAIVGMHDSRLANSRLAHTRT